MEAWPCCVPPGPSPAPVAADRGGWPRLWQGLDVVNRDVAATCTGTSALVLMVMPGSPQEDLADQIIVCLEDGFWQGNPVHPQDPSWDSPMDEPDDPEWIAMMIADAAQETILEAFWSVWPLCPTHDLGLHARPSGSRRGRDSHELLPGESAVWWCGGGDPAASHDVCRIGDLASVMRPGPRKTRPRRRRPRSDR